MKSIVFFFVLAVALPAAAASLACKPINSSNTAYAGEAGFTKSQQVVCNPDGSVAFASLAFFYSKTKGSDFSGVMISTNDCSVQGQLLKDKIAGLNWSAGKTTFANSAIFTELAKSYVRGAKNLVKPTSDECRGTSGRSAGSLILRLLDIR